MKMLTLCLFGFVLLSSFTQSQSRIHPYPPGLKEIETNPPGLEPPLQTQPPRVDPAQLQLEAAELAKLAQSIQPDIKDVTRGLLRKDVIEKLKQIEKLSKRLRSELSQ